MKTDEVMLAGQSGRAMPLRSCPAECEARRMDLPGGLMLFHLSHLRYMFFCFFISLNL